MRAAWPASHPGGARRHGPLILSAGLHLFVLALLLLRIVPLGAPHKQAEAPPAKVELVVQDTPTVGSGPREKAEKPAPASKAEPTAKPSPDAKSEARPTPPLPPLPARDKPDQVSLPKPSPDTNSATAKPAPPQRATEQSHPAPPVRLGLGGDAGTGLVRGPDVIPAGPDATVHNIPPAYPEAAAMLHEQGRVLLLVHVAPDGSAASVDVMESSGYLLLDRAAHDAVAKWHFRPAMASGAPVASQMPIEINFDLQARRAR